MYRASERHDEPASVFAALGCATRLALLTRLGDGREQSITELAHGIDLTRQAVTKHLRVLQHAGLVNARRSGRESRFTIQSRPISQAQDYLARVSGQWDQSLARLRSLVEP